MKAHTYYIIFGRPPIEGGEASPLPPLWRRHCIRQFIDRAVIVARLTYATSACWGFTTYDDRQRIEGWLRCGIRAGYYQPDCPTVENLVEDADDVLFRRILNNQYHLIHSLLPDKNSHGYDLRCRRHPSSTVLELFPSKSPIFVICTFWGPNSRTDFEDGGPIILEHDSSIICVNQFVSAFQKIGPFKMVPVQSGLVAPKMAKMALNYAVFNPCKS